MQKAGPLAAYEAALKAGEIQEDATQRAAVELLQSRADLLLSQRRFAGFRLPGRPAAGKKPGIYFWGDVGRGKTYLMDIFFESLPFDEKLRLHFHRFMYLVHQELRLLQGRKDPLQKVAVKMAGKARVLCFDEFYVSDIGDAMILYRLLEGLLDRGVMLIATSNVPPERLYEDGLQRRKFLPAIALLRQHTEVVNLDGEVDYRLRALTRAEVYHYPLNAAAEKALMDSFCRICPGFPRSGNCAGQKGQTLEILGRTIEARCAAEGAIWFDFADICEGPRSQNDYIVLARLYHTAVVSDVPRMDASRDNAARRFISLVDEFYDCGIKLLISAEVDVDDLYVGTRLAAEFTRTRSRLREMQSEDYLARPRRTS